MISALDALVAPDDLVAFRSLDRYRLGRVVHVHDGRPQALLLHGSTEPQTMDDLAPQGETYVAAERDVYAEAALSLAVDREWDTLDALLADLAPLRRGAVEPRPTPFWSCPHPSHNITQDLSGYVIYSSPPEDGYQQARVLAHVDNPYRYDLARTVVRNWRRLADTAVPAQHVISYSYVYRGSCWHV